MKKRTLKKKRWDDFRFEIANLITEIRYDKNLTQKQIAKKVGLKQSAITKIESGSQIPSLTTLYKILTKCGYAITFIFNQ